MRVSVNGSAKANVRPERATAHITVSCESASKEKVVAAVTELTNQVVHHITMLEQTDPSPITGYSVLPLSTSSWRPTSSKGQVKAPIFRASSDLQVTFHDFVALSDAIHRWSENEEVSVRQVSWALTDDTKERTEKEVLQQAVHQAKNRAQIIAESAGLQSIQFVEISDPGLMHGTPDVAMRYGAMTTLHGDDDVTTIELAPEDVTIAATIEARFDAQ